MDKILDILTEIEAEVEWSIHDGDGSEKIMALIHRAMDIAVKGKAHKWPEEKPVERKEYLVYEKQYGNHSVAFYAEGAFWEFFGGDSYELDVIHWWELPEVKE